MSYLKPVIVAGTRSRSTGHLVDRDLPGYGMSIGSDGEFESALKLVRGLIDTRTFKKERLDYADVREAFAVSGRYATAQANPRARLEAISTLGKAAEVSVPIAKAVSGPLLAALSSPLPPVGDWGAGEDRFYLAKAVAKSDAS